MLKFRKKFIDLSNGHIFFDISSLIKNAVAQNMRWPKFNFPMVTIIHIGLKMVRGKNHIIAAAFNLTSSPLTLTKRKIRGNPI